MGLSQITPGDSNVEFVVSESRFVYDSGRGLFDSTRFL